MSKGNEWDKIDTGIAIVLGVNGLAFCFGGIIAAILSDTYSTPNTLPMVLSSIIVFYSL